MKQILEIIKPIAVITFNFPSLSLGLQDKNTNTIIINQTTLSYTRTINVSTLELENTPTPVVFVTK